MTTCSNPARIPTESVTPYLFPPHVQDWGSSGVCNPRLNRNFSKGPIGVWKKRGAGGGGGAKLMQGSFADLSTLAVGSECDAHEISMNMYYIKCVLAIWAKSV